MIQILQMTSICPYLVPSHPATTRVEEKKENNEKKKRRKRKKKQ